MKFLCEKSVVVIFRLFLEDILSMWCGMGCDKYIGLYWDDGIC